MVVYINYLYPECYGPVKLNRLNNLHKVKTPGTGRASNKETLTSDFQLFLFNNKKPWLRPKAVSNMESNSPRYPVRRYPTRKALGSVFASHMSFFGLGPALTVPKEGKTRV